MVRGDTPSAAVATDRAVGTGVAGGGGGGKVDAKRALSLRTSQKAGAGTYFAHKKTQPPLGPPYVPRNSPIVGC